MVETYDYSIHLLPEISKICPNFQIDSSSGNVFCSIKFDNSIEFSISKLYSVLFEIKRNLIIEYFSISQNIIEDVILKISYKLNRIKSKINIPVTILITKNSEVTDNDDIRNINDSDIEIEFASHKCIEKENLKIKSNISNVK
jgi:hypothetical protein